MSHDVMHTLIHELKQFGRPAVTVHYTGPHGISYLALKTDCEIGIEIEFTSSYADSGALSERAFRTDLHGRFEAAWERLEELGFIIAEHPRFCIDGVMNWPMGRSKATSISNAIGYYRLYGPRAVS